MVVKSGKYGKFLACPNYPKCRNTKEYGEEEPLPPCPLCGKPLRRINYRKSVFYGCTGYPECKFSVTDKPTDKKCPVCGDMLLEKAKKDGVYYRCSNKDCNYSAKKQDEKTQQ